MKPTYEKIEKNRRLIIHQVFEDQRAPLGHPYLHVNLFHAYIEKIYAQGFKDGQVEDEPSPESEQAARARRRADGGHFG